MAGSRLDRIGTIFSRTTGLIRAGAVSYQDRPLWYDIYRVFPPKYEPHFARQPEVTEVHELLYREDKYRALFFKKYGRNPKGIPRLLNDRNFQEPSQPFVNACLELQRNNPEWDDDKIFNTAVDNLKQYSTGSVFDESDEAVSEAEMLAKRRQGGSGKPPTITVQSLKELFKQAKEKQEAGGGSEDSTKDNSTKTS